ncbi:MAG: hypothetical protein ABR520_11240 [Mycobacteriales bacterium]|nr:hypothetical protein [Actinomycetota bacterium]
MLNPFEHWYDATQDDCHAQVFRFVNKIEQEQADVYDRLMTLESLYDKHSPEGSLAEDPRAAGEMLNDMYENVVASNVDTTYASIATAEIRARFLTDGAGWSTQRRAAKMELYAEGLGKQLAIHRKCRLAFREAAKIGGGLVKVYADRWDQVCVEHIPLVEIVVPDADHQSGAPPLQLHHVMRNYDRDRLKAEFPEYADEIEAFRGTTLPANVMDRHPTRSSWAHNKVTVIESWRLPIGVRPAKDGEKSSKGARYVPGRHTITIATRTLLDEPYHKPYHPIAVIEWSARNGSFFPISGSERIVGLQRALNLRNWTIEQMLQQNARVTTWVRPADFGAVTKMQATEVGNFIPIKGEYPKTETPPAVHPELLNSRIQLKQSAADEFGQSQARQRGEIPAGLQTGAAVREATSAQTQRYAPQEAAFEQLVLDVNWLMIDACKDLGKAAPTVLESRWQQPIGWGEVDMGQVKIQIAAASTLPRTAAGREQTILEWAQAGVISTDTFRRLIGHPDLESEMSQYTAALDVIDLEIEAILDGGTAVPEPYDNLKMIEWRATQMYNRIRPSGRRKGAPEAVLESLRDYIDQAAFLASMQAQNDNAAPGAMPGAAPAGPPGQDAIATPPGGGPPTAALSPQAMQLRGTAIPSAA